MRIDSHQHFWKYNPTKHSWIDDQMQILKKDYLPNDLLPNLRELNIDGCIAVQADQSIEETQFLLDLAKNNTFILGVVGWLDLCSGEIESQLEKFQDNTLLKGLRHVLQGEVQRDFMLREDFIKGISTLKNTNLTYDILIFTDQIQYSESLVKLFPNQAFVIDHLAKPKIATQEIVEWAVDMRSIAKYENVFCKISGMVTEADWNNWKPKDFTKYLDVVVDAFGTERLMFGSDWPVALLSSSYSELYEILTNYFSAFSETEQANIFGENAKRFYNI
jgi:L-fuconolactonase